MIRIKNVEIAKALGISTAAVSMAVNNKPGVSDETRKKVQAYIAERQQPFSSTVPASMTPPVNLPDSGTMTNQVIVLCIHKSHGSIIIDKPFFSKMIEAIQTEAIQYGYSLVIVHNDSISSVEEYRQHLLSIHPSGIILLTTEMSEEDLAFYQNLRLPLVLLDGYFDCCPADSVTIDNATAILRAYKYAHSMGHKNIGYIKSSVWISNFEHRFDGFQKGVRMFEEEGSSPLVLSLGPNIEEAYLDMNAYLDQCGLDLKLPTCFICDLDYIAIGAMRALQEHGIHVPEDVSLIGFDDIEASQICNPPLTTISLHQNIIGMEAVRLLQQTITGQKNSYVAMQIASDFIVRDSVKKIR